MFVILYPQPKIVNKFKTIDYSEGTGSDISISKAPRAWESVMIDFDNTVMTFHLHGLFRLAVSGEVVRTGVVAGGGDIDFSGDKGGVGGLIYVNHNIDVVL